MPMAKITSYFVLEGRFGASHSQRRRDSDFRHGLTTWRVPIKRPGTMVVHCLLLI